MEIENNQKADKSILFQIVLGFKLLMKCFILLFCFQAMLESAIFFVSRNSQKNIFIGMGGNLV
jgi:hypothetical protein